MLLTCPNCHRSYEIDEQLYAQQGGAVCEVCHQPLTSLQTPVPDSMLGMPQQNIPPMGSSNFPGMASSNLPGMGASGLPGMSAPRLPGMGASTLNGMKPAGIPPMGPANIPPISGSTLPPIGSASIPPIGGSNLPGMAQGIIGGMGPISLGNRSGMGPAGGMPRNDIWQPMTNPTGSPIPMATMPVMDSIAPVNDAGKTMALDMEEDLGGFPNKPATLLVGNDDLKSSGVEPSRPGAIIVGRAMTQDDCDRITGEIDAADVQRIYGDQPHFVRDFFRSIPTRYLLILGVFLGVSILGFIITAIVITRPPAVEKEITKDGDVVPVGTERPRTFNDIVEESLAVSSAFLPFDGDPVKEGSIVAVTSDNGIYYDGKRIAESPVVKSGGNYVASIYDAIKDDVANMSTPVILLFDNTLTMGAVYRTMYSVAPASRRLLLGTTRTGGIASLDVQPCAWPDHDMFTFADCPQASYDVRVTRSSVKLIRTAGDLALDVDADGNELSELSDDLAGNRVMLTHIESGLSRIRTSGTGYVRFVVNPDVPYGVFLRTVMAVWGASDLPNVKEMYIAPIDI